MRVCVCVVVSCGPPPCTCGQVTPRGGPSCTLFTGLLGLRPLEANSIASLVTTKLVSKFPPGRTPD